MPMSADTSGSPAAAVRPTYPPNDMPPAQSRRPRIAIPHEPEGRSEIVLLADAVVEHAGAAAGPPEIERSTAQPMRDNAFDAW